MKYDISRQTFDLIFKECMKVNYTYTYSMGLEKMHQEKIKIKPCMVIRNFDFAETSNDDLEFTDNQKAWDYFNENPNCRIMDNAGNIYLDVF